MSVKKRIVLAATGLGMLAIGVVIWLRPWYTGKTIFGGEVDAAGGSIFFVGGMVAIISALR